MTLKKYGVLALVLIMAMLLPLGGSIPVAAELESGSADTSPGLHTSWMTETSTVNSTWVFNRTFEYYVPSSYTGLEAVPLLFSFHGLGSTGDQQRDLTRFDELAEQEGFIAVFPNSTQLDKDDPRWSAFNITLPALPNSNYMWNCGAINGTPIAPLQYVAGVDDVAFVSDMVSWFIDYFDINAGEVYSTGMSNGAMFSYYLAFELPDTFAAIAPVCAPMPLNLGDEYPGPQPGPMTVIVIRGDSDPVIPEPGECGLICDNFSFSTNETVAYWCGIDNTSTTPQVTTWAATESDPTSVTRYVYSGGTGGTQVILYWIVGGGHTWPGGILYSTYVGAVTTHIDGSAQIWKYVPPEKYYLAAHTTLGGSATIPGRGTFANVEFDGVTTFFPASSGPTIVDLVAVPDSASWEFVNWTGDVGTVANVNAANTTITIQSNTDYEVTANFQIKSVTPPGGCFIATAAYGTATAGQLDVLRAFRDNVLLKSTLGSRLVDLYYRTSPPIANFISQHEVLRAMVRELLIDPVVWIVRAAESLWQN